MFGDVTSANIVGYSTQTTESGYDFMAITPTFVSIGNDKVFNLSQISHNFSKNDSIQIFDVAGDMAKCLTYKETYWQLEDYTEDPDDPEITQVTDYEFPLGQSFWLSNKKSVDFTESGAVNKSKVVYELESGYDFVQAGNSRPTDLKLSEIEFSNLSKNDNLQIFDVAGDMLKCLTWKETYWQLEDYSEDPDDPEVSQVQDYTFKPGEHFWFSMKKAGTATIPALTL